MSNKVKNKKKKEVIEKEENKVIENKENEKIDKDENETKSNKKIKKNKTKKKSKINPGRGLTRVVALIMSLTLLFASAATLIFYLIYYFGD